MIPWIDISSLFGPASAEREACDRAIAEAAADTGFLCLTNFRAVELLTPEGRSALLRIFEIPAAEKARLLRRSFNPAQRNIYRGWYPLQNGVPSYKEGIDMGPDLPYGSERVDESDPLCETTPLPPEAVLPGWRAAAATYYRTMEETGGALMRAIARSLGLPETNFDAAFEGGISTLRLTRYPPRPAASLKAVNGEDLMVTHDGTRRMLINVPHVDSGFVTLLAQNGVAGLQARSRDGTWMDVPPREGSLAVNFGKLLERWTGGRIRATEHRVIGGEEERFSIPFFYEPGADTEIAPLPLAGAAAFVPFLYGDHLWEATTKFVEQRGIAALRKPRRGAPPEDSR